MSDKKVICPICDTGGLLEKTGKEDFIYKNIPFTIDDYRYSVCDSCGSEIVTSADAKFNARKIREKHKLIEGLLPADEIKRIRKKFGLTQHDAAELFGGGANAFSKYEKSEVTQSVSMDRLLRVADVVPSVFPALVKIVAKQTYRCISRQQHFTSSCDYGRCGLADSSSSNFPKKITPIYKLRQTEKKEVRKKSTVNWLDSAVS